MASNGLVANPSKTVFMVLNQREDRIREKRKIEVGNSLSEQSAHTKLLGIQIQESQKWDIHFRNLINALNYRLF